MNKESKYANNANILFRQWLDNTREMIQDTIFHSRIKKNQTNTISKRNIVEQDAHSYYFSCSNKNNFLKTCLLKDNPVSYIRNQDAKNILKNLQKGQYYPDIFLDLHGLTQYEAQKALGGLITVCQKEKIFCAHIMYGHGKRILKKQIPFWLSQHPDIIAFHQAPKVFGHDAAILVIIESNTLY